MLYAYACRYVTLSLENILNIGIASHRRFASAGPVQERKRSFVDTPLRSFTFTLLCNGRDGDCEHEHDEQCGRRRLIEK